MSVVYLYLSICILILRYSLSLETSMSGYHLNFTVIHEPPYVDCGLNDGVILPKSQWSGYMVDMISQISNRAGFTYELFLPSGNGANCFLDGSSNANNYGCGQNDAISLNSTDAYWSLYYITTARQNAGTLFTLPFLTNQGLGILTKTAGKSFFEEITLIFSPFSVEMWFMTVIIVAFVALIVYLQEVLQVPKRHARDLVAQFRTGINRKDASDYEDKIEETQLNYGHAIGLFDIKSSLSKLSSYFLGTFSGLMSASDTTSDDEEQVRPTGNFATTWVFFVLFWASAYTANLAARLTVSGARVEISDLEMMNRYQMKACAKSGAAYTTALGVVFPQLKIVPHSSTIDMVFAMERGECDGIVDTIGVLNGIANGVIDLDETSGKNFCDVDEQLLIAGEPRQYGLSDMAVGINSNRAYSQKLLEVLNHWITVFKTCAPKIPTSECWEGGTGGHALEYLRELHVEKNNCGDTHLSHDASTQQLGIANFFVPILGVAVAGIITIFICYWSIFRRIWKFKYAENLDSTVQVLVNDNPYVIKKTKFKTVDILMLQELYKILDSNEDHLLAFTRACLGYFMRTNMTLFFILLKMGAVYFPNEGLNVDIDDNDEDSRRMTILHCAAASRAEALKVLKFLIAKALRSHINDTNTLESYLIVCKDNLHHEMILKALKTLDDIKNIQTIKKSVSANV